MVTVRGNTTSIGIYESRDVKAVYDYIVAKGEKNIIIWGISMGAATALKAIDEFGIKPSKLILEMPFGSLHSAVQGRMKTMGLPTEPLSTLLTFWGGVPKSVPGHFNHRPDRICQKSKLPCFTAMGSRKICVLQKMKPTPYSAISPVTRR